MSAQPNNSKNNSKGTSHLVFIVIGMFGFGFALVPLYNIFCEVTGLNGKTGDQVTLAETLQVDTSREVVIEFVASLNESMPWEFEPMTRSMRVNPGQPTRMDYIARNTTNRTIIGQAVPSVAPGLAAQYFQKTECFCFTEQELKAGEEKEMPVIFVVDPELPADIKVLTLSYTFFIKPGSESQPLALN